MNEKIFFLCFRVEGDPKLYQDVLETDPKRLPPDALLEVVACSYLEMIDPRDWSDEEGNTFSVFDGKTDEVLIASGRVHMELVPYFYPYPDRNSYEN